MGQAVVNLLFVVGGANPSGPFLMYRGDFVNWSIFQMDLKNDRVCPVPSPPPPPPHP